MHPYPHIRQDLERSKREKKLRKDRREPLKACVFSFHSPIGCVQTAVSRKERSQKVIWVSGNHWMLISETNRLIFKPTMISPYSDVFSDF